MSQFLFFNSYSLFILLWSPNFLLSKFKDIGNKSQKFLNFQNYFWYVGMELWTSHAPVESSGSCINRFFVYLKSITLVCNLVFMGCLLWFFKRGFSLFSFFVFFTVFYYFTSDRLFHHVRGRRVYDLSMFKHLYSEFSSKQFVNINGVLHKILCY